MKRPIRTVVPAVSIVPLVPTFPVVPLVSFLIGTALLLGCATDAPVEVPRYDAATFFETTSVFGSSFSADETKILLSTDQDGTFNVYAQPIDGGDRVQLTQSTEESMMARSYFPADDRFLFSADQGGNELNHLFVQELDGSTHDLTPGDGHRASFAGWSGDREHFYVLTNEREPRFIDLYRYATDGYERELLYQNDGYFISGVSRDGRWVALNKVISNADSDVYVQDLQGGETVHVTPHEGPVSHGVVTFTPDSSELYYSTDGNGEFSEIWSYSLESQERSPVLQADWDAMYVSFSETGRYRVSAINADAQTEITIVDNQTGEELELPDLGAGDLQGVRFARSEERLLFYLNSDTAPSNLFVLELDGSDPLRLTDTLSPKVDPSSLVEGEVVRFASYDGLEIPGILYRPKQASSSAPVPAMLNMHGGPGGQSRKGYNATNQHLVNQGYAVFSVNNRGSSGYGKTFFHMDDKKHGDVDLKDCVWARKYLETLDWVDSERIGIMGGSYGGYLVAAALAFEPEVFDVGIDIFGVTNWVRTLESMPVWWGAQRDALFAELGNPETEAERLRAISPLFHASNIIRPLLVIQGQNDQRVLPAESDEIVEAVRANNVPVEYVVFSDEGHGFRKKKNRIAASEAFVSFLDEHLRGEQADSVVPPSETGGY